MRSEPRRPPESALRGLIAGVVSKPYAGIDGIAPHRIDELLFERWNTTMAAPGNQTWSIMVGERLAGAAVLVPLAWDTRVLGVAAARIDLLLAGAYDRAVEVASVLLGDGLDQARCDALVHLTCRVDAADDAAVHALESHGFLGVDALVTFAAAPEQLTAAGACSGPSVRPATPSDVEPVAEIAASSFSLGRFHSDPAISPDRARDVYREWARGCCRGTAADAVLLAETDGRLAGFVACRMTPDTITRLAHPVGTIPLIATTAQARGRGIGAALIRGAAHWFGEQRAMTVEVGTQLRNRAAARLYERCGFRVTAGALTFRRLIPA